MKVHNAEAKWEGRLKDGQGLMKLGHGGLEAPFSFSSRFENGEGTTPEELIGAAAAGCFSMALAKTLSESGRQLESIQTKAEVELEKLATGFAIPRMRLFVEADVADINEDQFKNLAESAKIACPVSKALGGVVIDLRASLAT
ncbi:MAG: OsmC family peroxiredoxin [Phycisphaerae bacterium]|jgi:osmotically inducible protein OsmC